MLLLHVLAEQGEGAGAGMLSEGGLSREGKGLGQGLGGPRQRQGEGHGGSGGSLTDTTNSSVASLPSMYVVRHKSITIQFKAPTMTGSAPPVPPTPYQHTLSTQLLNTPSQHTLSTQILIHTL